jgi:TetR/AcrR family transcriptional regulator, transcriptional repressor for nem operon
VRYSKEHKQATRQRIIEAAGRRFNSDGIDGSGIAALMTDAGLTNGAFYAHFDSKDELVATTVAHQLSAHCESVGVLLPGRASVERLVREYLSVQHRVDPGNGCPSAALMDEIGRCADATNRCTPTACWRSSATSPSAWRRMIRSRHTRRCSASTP